MNEMLPQLSSHASVRPHFMNRILMTSSTFRVPHAAFSTAPHVLVAAAAVLIPALALVVPTQSLAAERLAAKHSASPASLQAAEAFFGEDAPAANSANSAAAIPATAPAPDAEPNPTAQDFATSRATETANESPTASEHPEADSENSNSTKNRALNRDDFKVEATASQPDAIKDPLEDLNRKIFRFNVKMDREVLLPVAKVYRDITPKPVNDGITRFFSNLREPWSAANALLQREPREAGRTLGRFAINSLVSLGFADPASSLGLDRNRRDFGQTLASWGMWSGPFVMLPFIGPSTFRDTLGQVADRLASPSRLVDNTGASLALAVTDGIDTRADLIGVEDLVQGDQYTLIRDVYLQRRHFLISNSGKQVDQTPPAIDEGFGDDEDTAIPSASPSAPPAPSPESTTSDRSIPPVSATPSAASSSHADSNHTQP